MRSLPTPSVVALAVAGLLAALSLVTWRQSRALSDLAELDRVRQERSVAEAEVGELQTIVHFFESRRRVVPEARERLGMHVPADWEIVTLPGAEQ